jgi:hypothetical protein
MEHVNCKHWAQEGKAGGRCALLDKSVSYGYCRFCQEKGKGCDLLNPAQPLLIQIELPDPAKSPPKKPKKLENPKGAGTQLKKMLAVLNITVTPDCSCNARARTMNEKGTQWCRDNIDTIVGWLREEAAKRGLPFVAAVAKWVVKRAIRKAEQEAKQSV